MAPPAPTLMEELVEEILLRLPPGEPASLVRATLVCKPWSRLICGPGFCRRFRELHRTPPMLGFLLSSFPDPQDATIVRFVPTTAATSPLADRRRHWRALDARHGRVLLGFYGGLPQTLVVWDPIRGDQRELPFPSPCTMNWNAAILCAAAAGTCDHLDCHRGPFLVVFVGSYAGDTHTLVWTYSSDAASWSQPISTQLTDNDRIHCLMPSVLVGNALYFRFMKKTTALKYDLDFHETSVIGLPPESSYLCHAVLTATEDDVLGFASVLGSKLCIWSRKAGAEVDARWILSRVIDLETPLTDDAIFLTPPVVIGSADGDGVIFLRANRGLYTADLKTNKVKKVCEGRYIFSVLPFVSFYTPVLGAVCTGDW